MRSATATAHRGDGVRSGPDPLRHAAAAQLSLDRSAVIWSTVVKASARAISPLRLTSTAIGLSGGQARGRAEGVQQLAARVGQGAQVRRPRGARLTRWRRPRRPPTPAGVADAATHRPSRQRGGDPRDGQDAHGGRRRGRGGRDQAGAVAPVDQQDHRGVGVAQVDRSGGVVEQGQVGQRRRGRGGLRSPGDRRAALLGQTSANRLVRVATMAIDMISSGRVSEVPERLRPSRAEPGRATAATG